MEHLQTVQKIFSDKVFKIPDYQRGYAWDEKQWKDLIEDLDMLSSDQQHYTGTIVLKNSGKELIDQELRKLEQYDVVDGQQRLTTIIILLHCISTELKKIKKENQVDGIRRGYVIFKDEYDQEKARLTLNNDTHDFFLNNIIAFSPTLEGPVNQSQIRLDKALDYFTIYLEEKRTENNGSFDKWLRELYIKITNSMEFTVYEVRHSSEVGVIFEVMNNRGKPLSEMEKVKNYMLYLSSKLPAEPRKELSESINVEIGKLFRKLTEAGVSSSKQEDQLLRMSWIMSHNPSSKEWKGYESIKSSYSLRNYLKSENVQKKINDIKEYIKLLSESSLAYCDVMAPSHDGSFSNLVSESEIRNRIVQKTINLSRIGNMAPFLPVLMAARMKYPTDAGFFIDLLDVCEKYAFRIYRLHNSRSNTGQSSLFKIGYDLYKNYRSPEKTIKKIIALLLYYSPNDRYIKKFDLGNISWYHFYGLKYFLYEYEKFLSKGRGIVLPWEKLAQADKKETIEHILPQEPARDYWKERWEKDQIEKYLHDIGNLILTFDNSTYSNKPFTEKKGMPGLPGCYANANLFQEKELAIYDHWTEKELLERRDKIINWAIERWHVEPVEMDEDVIPEEEDEIEEEQQTTIDRELREWTEEKLSGYLERMRDRGRWTFNYLKILARSERPLRWEEVCNEMQELTGKEFTGRNSAGMFAGLYRHSEGKRRDRLDIQNNNMFRINEKYREVIRKNTE